MPYVAMKKKVAVVVELLREHDLIWDFRQRSYLCPVPPAETHPITRIGRDLSVITG